MKVVAVNLALTSDVKQLIKSAKQWAVVDAEIRLFYWQVGRLIL